MDDLKLYADTEEDLEKHIKTAHILERHCNGIWSRYTIRKEQKCQGKTVKIEENTYIDDLEHDSTYRYLGIEEYSTIEHRTMRNKAKRIHMPVIKIMF